MKTERNYNWLIYAFGVLLAVAVALIYVTPKVDMSGTWMDALPMVNATINGTVSLLLVTGLFFVKSGKIRQHKITMTAAIVLSAVFLISYVAYHVTHESTTYGGDGAWRSVYYFILITHILLAAVVAPMVLVTYVRALNERFDKHRKLARITFPVWLYVSITGVLVYLFISPYY